MPAMRPFRLTLALAGAGILCLVGCHVVRAASWAQQPPMNGTARGEMPSSMSMGPKSVTARNAPKRPRAAIAALGIAGEQHITVYVLPGGNGLGFSGPDGNHHDTMVPSSFVMRQGVPVTFTVINLDDMSHTITVPGLGVNIVIKPGIDGRDGAVSPSRTVYTFTPARAGEFRWFCVIPCDMPTHWAMSASYDGPDRDGFMAGIIRVL